MLQLKSNVIAARALQTALAQHCQGLPSKFIDGQFGPTTTKVLKAFQAAYGLVPDGIYGPKTQRALDRPASGACFLAPKNQEAFVARLNHYVDQVGLPLRLTTTSCNFKRDLECRYQFGQATLTASSKPNAELPYSFQLSLPKPANPQTMSNASYLTLFSLWGAEADSLYLSTSQAGQQAVELFSGGVNSANFLGSCRNQASRFVCSIERKGG